MSTADPISLAQAKRYAANADTILLRATRPADLETCVAQTEAALSKRPAAFPRVIATSSREGDGIPDLRAAIAKLKAERGE